MRYGISAIRTTSVFFAVFILAGCAAGNSSGTTSTARSEPREMPECLTGETLTCQTHKTGFGRLSTGRKTNYDFCSCEPTSVVIQDRPLPQY